MSKKKQYLIDADTLRGLLYGRHKLAILARDEVDTWSRYMKSKKEYLVECASMLPWNEGRSNEDLMAQIEDENYQIISLVNDQINAFWEEFVHPCDDCAFGSMST